MGKGNEIKDTDSKYINGRRKTRLGKGSYMGRIIDNKTRYLIYEQSYITRFSNS